MTADAGPLARMRARLLAERRQLTESEIAARSLAINRRWIEHGAGSAPAWRGRRVGIYRALPGEVRLDALETWLRRAGAEICFPRLAHAEGAMDFIEFGERPSAAAAGEGFSAGPWGLEQPPADRPAVDPAHLDAIFLPGVAFAPDGARIGMGKGYYDRFLPRAPSALRIALAWDFSVVPRLEQKPWDQRVHWVMTETRDFRGPEVAPWLARQLL